MTFQNLYHFNNLFLLVIHEDGIDLDLWRSIYGSPDPVERCFQQDGCTFAAHPSSLYISECIFKNSNSGAVVIDNGETKFLHTSCTFENLSRPDQGGAVFYHNEGPIVQRRFCAKNVYTVVGEIGFWEIGLFCYAKVSMSYDKPQNKNFISEGSVCQGSDEKCIGTLYLYYGNISVDLSNTTKSIVGTTSGISTSDSESAKIKFSNFEENEAKINHCITSSGSKAIYEYCNVINNIQPESETNGCFNFDYGSSLIQYCTIRGNSANCPTFSFMSRPKEIKVIHCNIDSETTNGEVESSTFELNINKEEYTAIQNIWVCEKANNDGKNAKWKVTIEIYQILSYLNNVFSMNLCSYFK